MLTEITTGKLNLRVQGERSFPYRPPGNIDTGDRRDSDRRFWIIVSLAHCLGLVLASCSERGSWCLMTAPRWLSCLSPRRRPRYLRQRPRAAGPAPAPGPSGTPGYTGPGRRAPPPSPDWGPAWPGKTPRGVICPPGTPPWVGASCTDKYQNQVNVNRIYHKTINMVFVVNLILYSYLKMCQ